MFSYCFDRTCFGMPLRPPSFQVEKGNDDSKEATGGSDPALANLQEDWGTENIGDEMNKMKSKPVQLFLKALHFILGI